MAGGWAGGRHIGRTLSTWIFFLASPRAAGRITWKRVGGYIPEADLSTVYTTLDDAKTVCARDAECAGFTFVANMEEHVPGAVLRVWFKRSSEWYPEEDNGWASFVKTATPCKSLAYRVHPSGLLCCEGACPRDIEEMHALECATPIAIHEGVLPLCSALDAPLRTAGASGARLWPPTRVLNLARAGVASMSSAYASGLASWQQASAGNDHSVELSSMVHTNCGPSEWWRVELPTDSEVAQVAIVNRADFAFRILDFQLELISDDNRVLEVRPFRRSANHTAFTFDPPVQPVRRVQIRGSVDKPQCLHVREVQVFGRAVNTRAEHARVSAFLGAAELGLSAEWADGSGGGSARLHSPTESVTSFMWFAGVTAAVLLVGMQVWHLRTYLALL